MVINWVAITAGMCTMSGHDPFSNLPKQITSSPVAAGQAQSFMGYHRADGRVGTHNYWIVIPLFADETHSYACMRDAFLRALGYCAPNRYEQQLQRLREQYRAGSYFNEPAPMTAKAAPPFFANIDGIKFLPALSDFGDPQPVPESRWSVLTHYCMHPNVGGITVLSLGDQAEMIYRHINQTDPTFAKPLLVVDRYAHTTESDWLTTATLNTFQGLAELNKQNRQPAPCRS